MHKVLKIGTRDSELAVWQAQLVKEMLAGKGFKSELIFIKSDGDIDLITPIYEMNVQGVFTKSLDIALLNKKIDIAVHSMKDVPTQLAKGIAQAAVLSRGSYKDLLVYKSEWDVVKSKLDLANQQTSNIQHLTSNISFTIATSSIRRKAQWLNRYPNHRIETLRGNVNTRLKKLNENNWNGVILAAAGLERINLRPKNSIDLDWMLPAPAQGAIMIVCNEEDEFAKKVCELLNDKATALCTKIERDFLKALLGGCSTPISALAVIKNDEVIFKGNVLSNDGKEKMTIEKKQNITTAAELGTEAADELLQKGADKLIAEISRG
ncbi:MAG: hydroxymethylbilane synthase [Chitinophagaceae bacterium]